MHCQVLTFVIGSAIVVIPAYVAMSTNAILRQSRARKTTRASGSSGFTCGGTRVRVPVLESLTDYAFSLRDRTLCKLLTNLLCPGATVCDVGCGEGHLLKTLTKAGLNAYGVDIDIDMVVQAQQSVDPSRVIHSDLTELPSFVSFDAILFCDSLRYMIEPHKVIFEALKLARFVVITEPYALWHRLGRILLLRFLHRVDHVTFISYRSLPIRTVRRGLFHKFLILSGSGMVASLQSFTDQVERETSWVESALLHPAFASRLKRVTRLAALTSVISLVGGLVYATTC